jgi:hemin uptake protein HemP
MTPNKPSGHGKPPETEQTIRSTSPTLLLNPAEPWIDSKTLLGEQGVVLIRHEGLTYRLQATRFGKLLLTK